MVLACGAWMKTLLQKLELDLPLTPLRVDVPYWEIKEEYRGRYDIENFPAGFYDHRSPYGDNLPVYWLVYLKNFCSPAFSHRFNLVLCLEENFE